MIASSAPDNYECPICFGIQGSDSSKTLIKPSDFVYKDELVTALVNTFFIGQNAGHVIIVPNDHYENMSHLP